MEGAIAGPQWEAGRWGLSDDNGDDDKGDIAHIQATDGRRTLKGSPFCRLVATFLECYEVLYRPLGDRMSIRI
jgi:hypothetical protein